MKRYALEGGLLFEKPGGKWIKDEDFNIVREALIDLVGARNRIELEQMEVVIRMSDAPSKDKMHIINAIHTIIDTE